MKRYFALPCALSLLAMVAIAAPANAAPGRHERRAQRGVSFYATVLSANRAALVVRSSSGRTLRFSAAELRRHRTLLAKRARHHRRHHPRHARRQLAHAALRAPMPHGPLVSNVAVLQPGVIVFVTESVNHRGRVRVRIALPPANITVQETASGVVTAVRDDAFEMTTAGGTELRLQVARRRLASVALQRSDSISVTYHQRAGALVADDIRVTAAKASRQRTSRTFRVKASSSAQP